MRHKGLMVGALLFVACTPGRAYTNDVNPTPTIAEAERMARETDELSNTDLAGADLVVGLGKSVIFAFIIAFVAADEGLNVEGRVTAISEATTRGVVYSVLGVLGADTLVNVIFYFIPGLA